MFPWTVLVTGAVGVGGTALGAWLNGRTQTKNLHIGIVAETERSLRVEKKQLYAGFIAAMDNVISERAKIFAYQTVDDDGHPLLTAELAVAIATLTNRHSELMLIAPRGHAAIGTTGL